MGTILAYSILREVKEINKAESVSKSRERIDFSAQIADARAILKNARL